MDYGKGAKYKVKGEIPSQSRPIYATLLTGLPVCEHGIIHNAIGKTLDIPNLFSLCKENGGVTAAAAYSWVSELFNQSPFQYERDYIQLNTGKQIDHGIFYWEDMYPDSHTPEVNYWTASLNVGYRKKTVKYGDRLKNPVGFTVGRYALSRNKVE